MTTSLPLKIYDSAKREKVAFAPLDPKHVKMYVCGPTVYARVHIGNARPNVVFDVLYRLFRSAYPKVTYVRNITDVDDKIIKRAEEENLDIEALTQETTKFFQEDMNALGVLEPTLEPRATAHIGDMIALIQILIDKGHAYVAENHVLFDVTSQDDYGTFSGRSLEEMQAGARVEVAAYKKNPLDFILWKPAKPGEPAWESPWGKGRPGWHIECSAMAHKHLGERFDLHGGGRDLLFPHHENEVAQSTCAHGKGTFANHWMHCGMITVSGTKMSKSLGNITPMDVLFEQAHPEVIRMAILMTHYRRPLDWSDETLHQSKAALDRFYGVLKAADLSPERAVETSVPVQVQEALCDDLNTPLAISVLFDIAKQFFGAEDTKTQASLAQQLLAGAGTLGLLQHSYQDWYQTATSADAAKVSAEEIEAQLKAREKARADRDFAQADKIRDELEAMGVLLEDSAEGTTWRWKH